MTNAAVDYLTTESAPQKLWKEFLSGYFDGGSHEIGPSGTGAVTFPSASITFDQSALEQPLNGIGITILTQTVDSNAYQSEAGKSVINSMRWNFMVRAASMPAGQGTPEYGCRVATEKLKALLLNDYATKPLQAKGMNDLQVSESEPIQSTTHILRRLKVLGRLEYEVPTQPL